MPFSRRASAGDAGDAPKGACSRSSGTRACRRTTTQPSWRYAALHGNIRYQLSEPEGREVFSLLVSVARVLPNRAASRAKQSRTPPWIRAVAYSGHPIKTRRFPCLRWPHSAVRRPGPIPNNRRDQLLRHLQVQLPQEQPVAPCDVLAPDVACLLHLL